MKHQRHIAIIACFVFLTVSAGCTGMGVDLGLGFGGGDAATTENTEYTWNTSADATLRLDTDQYQSVYKLGQRNLTVYTHDSLGDEQPLELKAAKYRYPNGTVITPDETKSFSIENANKKTTIHTPNASGMVAFVTEKPTRSVQTPVFLKSGKSNGSSYEVILPPNTGVSLPLLSVVRPNNHETETIDGRTHITWESVESDGIYTRYYLQRDVRIFGGIAGLLIVGGLIGVAYYLVQIRKLERIRKNIGLDIDTGEES